MQRILHITGLEGEINGEIEFYARLMLTAAM
jgi:hypothetical protein